MTKEEFKNIHTVVVHTGNSHADDQLTVAYLQHYRSKLGYGPLKVIRTFYPTEKMTLDNGYIVADIGRGKYDHHFPEYEKERRANGVAYAAFGLIVRDFHDGLLNDTEYKFFDKKLIEPLDYHDNYGSISSFADVMKSFNKPWNSDDPNEDLYFFDAVKVLMIILDKYIENTIRPMAVAYEVAQIAVPDGNTIYLAKYAPIGEFFANDPVVKFIGSPSKRGTYQVQTVKDSENKDKMPFPEHIRGISYSKDEYDDEGLSFCHSSGFLASFRDKEAARAFMKNHMEG